MQLKTKHSKKFVNIELSLKCPRWDVILVNNQDSFSKIMLEMAKPKELQDKNQITYHLESIAKRNEELETYFN